MSKIPIHGTVDYEQWLEQKDFLQFLLDTSHGDVPLYVSYKGTYIYSVFLPQNCLRGNYIDDLMKWNCRPDSSWGYSYSYGVSCKEGVKRDSWRDGILFFTQTKKEDVVHKS